MTVGRRLEILNRILLVALALAVLNTGYLSWRFVALHAGWVAPGTGICSWTETVDCDKVLITTEARAFYVPNALLGFGFFFGCLLWWTLGNRLGAVYRYHIARTLVVWLVIATLFTFRFFWLLVHLDAFCPLCPWNHLLTYIALVAAFLIWRATPRPTERVSIKPLVLLVGPCVSQFFLLNLIWVFARTRSLL